jgi:hypothetical protein
MLNPDAVAEYEAWREHKLVTSQDLSIHAFNAEMVANAAAWDEGVRAAVGPGDSQKVNSLLDGNPYRQPGMRAELR